jgi:hypothetical protein
VLPAIFAAIALVDTLIKAQKLANNGKNIESGIDEFAKSD